MALNIGRAMRICRAVQDMRQGELAKAIGVGASMVSLAEAGKRTTSLPSLERIADAFGIPLEWFIVLASDADTIESIPGATCAAILHWMQKGRA